MKRLTLAAALLLAFAGAAHAKPTELVIYKGEHFRGPSDTIKGEVANLEHGFGREVSSLVARGGTWEVCTGDHFTGRCRTLAEGEYPTLGNLDERIMSVRFLGENYRVAREDKRDDWYERRREAVREERREERREAREAARDARDSWYGRSDWPQRGDDRGYR